ncbi:MAG: peptide MFS transporter [Flavobacteriales bacterium]
MMIGHFVMAIEKEFFLYIALAFLIMGNGFFKPNISSMVGGLYNEGDSRRDGGFTIFYMGINLGALLAPLVCGYIGQTYGWFYGFGLAGVGMLLGILIFGSGRKRLGENGGVPNKELLYEKVFLGLNRENLIYILSVAAVALVALLVRFYETVEIIIPVVTLGVMAFVLVQSFLMKEKVHTQRLWVILILTTVNIFFWAFFEQAGSSLTLLADSNVDRNIFGWVIPASVFQSVNPGFILILAPIFSWLWISLGSRGKEPSTPLKFVFGMVLLGIGFLALSFGVSFVSVVGGLALMPLIFLILSYMLQTCGELSLSPVGLSMITKLSPAKMTAQLMGLWFLSTALSHTVAGQIAKLTTTGGNQEVAAILDKGVEKSRKNEDFHFNESDRMKLESWKNESFVNKLESDINSGSLSKEQASTIATGNKYKLEMVMEDSLNGGKLKVNDMEALIKNTRAPMKRELENKELAKKAKNILTKEGAISQEEKKTLYKWKDNDEDLIDTLYLKMKKNDVLSDKQFELIAKGNSRDVKEALNDSLVGGTLTNEKINTYVSEARSPGKVAVNNELLEKEQLDKYEKRTLSSFDQLSKYSSVYQMVGLIAIGTGLVLIIMIPKMRKWMHGVH